MIGTILYTARIVDDKVKLFPHKIIKVTKEDKYKLSGKKYKNCYTYDVGVILFLTKKEAISYLIKELKHFVEMGETYLKRTEQQLKDAKEFLQKQ